jgi:hypothetical protein
MPIGRTTAPSAGLRGPVERPPVSQIDPSDAGVRVLRLGEGGERLEAVSGDGIGSQKALPKS